MQAVYVWDFFNHTPSSIHPHPAAHLCFLCQKIPLHSNDLWVPFFRPGHLPISKALKKIFWKTKPDFQLFSHNRHIQGHRNISFAYLSENLLPFSLTGRAGLPQKMHRHRHPAPRESLLLPTTKLPCSCPAKKRLWLPASMPSPGSRNTVSPPVLPTGSDDCRFWSAALADADTWAFLL